MARMCVLDKYGKIQFQANYKSLCFTTQQKSILNLHINVNILT